MTATLSIRRRNRELLAVYGYETEALVLGANRHATNENGSACEQHVMGGRDYDRIVDGMEIIAEAIRKASERDDAQACYDLSEELSELLDELRELS